MEGDEFIYICIYIVYVKRGKRERGGMKKLKIERGERRDTEGRGKQNTKKTGGGKEPEKDNLLLLLAKSG